MNRSYFDYINNVLKPLGVNIKKVREQQIEQTYIKFLEGLLLSCPNKPKPSVLDKEEGLDVNFIIFSKDRAIQLHALLSSLLANVLQSVKVHVLYFASNSQHEKAYLEVRNLFFNKNIVFIKEQQFRSDLITLVNNFTVSKVIFLVDDIVFTEPLNLHDFIKYDPCLYVASLRMGVHLNFSYTMQQPQSLPIFLSDINNEDKIIWKWREGVLDWNYPLSVDGHLFSLHEIKTMLPLINFKAPNSLEEGMQLFKPFYLQKLGLAYKKAKILNIPCNKVQNENNNISEEVTIDSLLQKWESGLQIDYSKFMHFKNNSAHQFIPFDFIKR